MMIKIALAASALATVRGRQVDTMISFHCHGCPDAVFKAHLHADTCANDGGGHYNGGGTGAVDAVNENWPEVTCSNGRCSGMASNEWAPAPGDVDTLSIVVHDTPASSSGSGNKMLCADLTGSAGQYDSDNVAYLPFYLTNHDSGYGDVHKGSASMDFAGISTSISFRCRDCPDDVFKAHLHADTCANNGGGHYNGGGTGAVDAVNENWPAVTCTNGRCSGMASNDWVPDVADLVDGLSIVVHDTPAASSGSGNKMLCADLGRSGLGSFTSDGVAYLPDYLTNYDSGYGDVHTGEASLMKPELATTVSFRGRGFPDDVFKAHLHADTCANNGGGHYDGGGTGAVDAVNENWPEVTCSNGQCSGMAWNDWWVPGGDLVNGLSIVVHDTPAAGSGSGDKMLCADLGEGRGGSWSGKFDYLDIYEGNGYGKAGQSSATLKYGTDSPSRRGRSSALVAGEAQGAQVSNGALVAGACSLGLFVAAAALFAKMKRSKATPDLRSEETEYAAIPLVYDV